MKQVIKIKFPKGELAHNTYKCNKCGETWKMKSIYPTGTCPECGGTGKPLD